jgi:hypothetical protein
MNLEIVTAFAELLGAFAVVASLVYLGVQTRKSAIEDRARTMHDISVAFSDWQMTIGTDSDVARLWAVGISDYENLDGIERVQFMMIFSGVNRILEDAFLQYKAGRMDEHIWKPYISTMLAVTDTPGVREYFETRSNQHTKDFIDMVNGLSVEAS